MRLVVQGSSIQLQHLVHIHQLSQSKQGAQFVQIALHAYYLPHQDLASQDVIDFCKAQAIDCAYVPEKQTLRNIKLAVMDMDSTLINIECIDEIADFISDTVAAGNLRVGIGEELGHRADGLGGLVHGLALHLAVLGRCHCAGAFFTKRQ